MRLLKGMGAELEVTEIGNEKEAAAEFVEGKGGTMYQMCGARVGCQASLPCRPKLWVPIGLKGKLVEFQGEVDSFKLTGPWN